MKTIPIAVSLLSLIAAAPVRATATVSDPTGDFLPSFAGPASSDLDVTSFSVNLDPSATTFSIGAVLAGDINPALAGFIRVRRRHGDGLDQAVRVDR